MPSPSRVVRKRPWPPALAALLAGVLACDPPLRVQNVPDGPLPAGTLWPLGSSGRGGVAWTVDDSTVATVTAEGIVWARSPGETRVRVWRGADHAETAVEVAEASEGKIVFVGDHRVRVVRPDGLGETVLPVEVRGRLDVSPDGSAVAFTRPDGDGGIYWMRLDGTGLRRVSPDTAYDVAFVGADRLVYNGSLGSAIRMVDLADGTVTTLWSEEPPREDGATLFLVRSPTWGGGDTLYFSGTTRGFPYDERLGAYQALDSVYVARMPDIAGTRRTVAHALARSPDIPWPGPPAMVAIVEGISVSPDRQWLLVNYLTGTWSEPMYADASDPGAEPVPYGPESAAWSVWSTRLNHLGNRAVAVHAGPTPYLMGGIVVFGMNDSDFTWVIERPGMYITPVWSP